MLQYRRFVGAHGAYNRYVSFNQLAEDHEVGQITPPNSIKTK